MSKTRILIADDHAIVRMGLSTVLNTNPDFEVVGMAEDGEDAVRQAETLQPDLVLMDLMMPVKDGVAATAEIHARHPNIKVLILTTFGTANGIAHAIRSGAAGAIMKNIAYDKLVKALHETMNGKQVIASEIRRALKDMPLIPELTDKQLEILNAMARGLTDAEIATEFGVSVNSIRDHAVLIFAKLQAANRTEAVATAFRKYILKT